MGYTHYYRFKEGANIDKKRWNRAVEIGKACMEKSNVPIAGGSGDGEPEFTEDIIYLNGIVPYEHETFYLRRTSEGGRMFCKTARKPYDIVVCCFLLALKEVFGDDFEYSSDGVTREDLADEDNQTFWREHLPNWTPKVDDEWEKAYKLYESVRKEALAVPMQELNESEDERMVRIIEDVICTNEGEVIAQKYGLKLTDLADWLEKLK